MAAAKPTDATEMPTIAFVSSKGGTGKTTAALLLALGLREAQQSVTVIDCDPNLPLFSWAKRNGALRVFPAITHGELAEILPLAKAKSNWIIIDTEGSIRGRALLPDGEIDLAIIPVGGSALEAEEAVRTSNALRSMRGRVSAFMPHACLITRMPAALKPGSLKHMLSRLREAEISILDTPLVEKEAFKTLFFLHQALEEMDPKAVSGLEGARTNAAHFAGTIIKLFAPRPPAALTARQDLDPRAAQAAAALLVDQTNRPTS
jgi:chromosome partitioning protein